jgi:hypothetical protein
MVDFDPAFRHDLLQITVRNRISDIEEHRVQDHRSGIVAPFEINRHVLILTHEFKRRRLTQAGQTTTFKKFATEPKSDAQVSISEPKLEKLLNGRSIGSKVFPFRVLQAICKGQIASHGLPPE